MRRFLSILLALAFGLGPLAFAFGHDDSASLPACCRRHGVHHCAMGATTQPDSDRQSDSFAAPAHCPLFPAHQNASPSSTSVIVPRPATAPLSVRTEPTAAAIPFAKGNCDFYTFTLRGPPALFPA